MFFRKNKTKIRDMSKEKLYNEEVKAEESVNGSADDSLDNQAKEANMADSATPETDTMADAGEPEEVNFEAEAAIWRDKFLRLQAEFDNYRKRTLKEKMELVESGGQDVLKAVLPVVDDVQRAVDAMQKSDDVEALRRGVELISQKFIETLKQKRVTEIEAKGLEFNEEFMEAVAKFPAGEESKGKVIDVVQSGYMLGEKVLRYAKVVVGE